MKKEFNIAGSCLPPKHYMVDISAKIEATLKLIKQGEYFIINRPRQYGKTTILNFLTDALYDMADYLPISISFEGIEDAEFADAPTFNKMFLSQLRDGLEAVEPELAEFVIQQAPTTQTFMELGYLITKLVRKAAKKVVLLIDEVDGSSNNDLFIKFLAQLRTKYLKAKRFRYPVPTFHSVILTGVHDVKHLKLKMRPEEQSHPYNSPWNIAVPFKVDMSFSPVEIQTMLQQYVEATGVEMNQAEIAQTLHQYTSGHPFLTSLLCWTIEEELLPKRTDKQWVKEDILRAIQKIIYIDFANFQTLIKNLEHYPDLYQITKEVLTNEKNEEYDSFSPIIKLGLIHGMFINGKNIRIHNEIYKERISLYMISKTFEQMTLNMSSNLQTFRYYGDLQVLQGRLNVRGLVEGFQAFMKEERSEKNHKFLEKEGRLIFLAFLKPFLNGRGHAIKEAQISAEKRLDLLITFGTHKHVIELKRWEGPKYHERGLDQLADYLERQGLEEGYLVIFDFRSRSQIGKQEDIVRKGKKIYAVWV